MITQAPSLVGAPMEEDVDEEHVRAVLARHGVKGLAPTWTALAREILRDWARVHGAAFPDGNDYSDVRARLALSATVAWETMGGEHTFGGRRRNASRRTLCVLAACLRLPRQWKTCHSAECKKRTRSHRFVTEPGVPFDPQAKRYAVYADVLPGDEVKRLRGLPERTMAMNAGKRKENVAMHWKGISNELSRAASESRRVQFYCGGPMLGLDVCALLRSQCALGEGYATGRATRTASIIYTQRHRKHERQQGWHTDYASSTHAGDKHLSVIFALDDGFVLPVVGSASLSDPMPECSEHSVATTMVSVPKGGCVIFRGDTVHAGMRDTGRSVRRLHVYVAKGTAAYVDRVVDNKVHFVL